MEYPSQAAEELAARLNGIEIGCEENVITDEDKAHGLTATAMLSQSSPPSMAHSSILPQAHITLPTSRTKIPAPTPGWTSRLSTNSTSTALNTPNWTGTQP